AMHERLEGQRIDADVLHPAQNAIENSRRASRQLEIPIEIHLDERCAALDSLDERRVEYDLRPPGKLFSQRSSSRLVSHQVVFDQDVVSARPVGGFVGIHGVHQAAAGVLELLVMPAGWLDEATSTAIASVGNPTNRLEKV